MPVTTQSMLNKREVIMGNIPYSKPLPSLEAIIEASGIGLLILDENQAVSWANPQLLMWINSDEEIIAGKQWVELPFDALDNDGNTLCIYSDNQQKKIFSHWQVKLNDGFHIAHYFKEDNVSSSHTFRSSNHLPQRASWSQFLDYEVSRSRRYDNPLSILKIKFIVYGEDEMTACHLKVSEILKEELRWADMIGQSQAGEFLVVLPETSQNALPALKNKLLQSVSRCVCGELSPEQYQLLIGESSWVKGDTSVQLLERARNDLLTQLEAIKASFSS